MLCNTVQVPVVSRTEAIGVDILLDIELYSLFSVLNHEEMSSPLLYHADGPGPAGGQARLIRYGHAGDRLDLSSEGLQGRSWSSSSAWLMLNGTSSGPELAENLADSRV